jgi:hypothetical protein
LSGAFASKKKAMIDLTERKVDYLAVRKGFRLDRIGLGEDRYYVIELATGGKMPSDVPYHPYSFTLEEANEWLEAREDKHRTSE